MRTIKKKAMSARILLPALLLASGLPVVLSCDKVPAGEQPGDSPIAFNSAVSTKAPVESENAMTEFAVWAAYYSNEVLDSEPFVNTKVYKATDGTWTYDDIKYWQEGDWHFEAFYPLPSDLQATEPVQRQDALKVTFTAPKDKGAVWEGLTIDYYYGPTASHDLMTAEHTRHYTATDPNASAVDLIFNHLLSRVTISVKTSSSNVSLTSLTFSGMSVLGGYNTEGNPGNWRLLTSIPELSNVPPGSFSADPSELTSPLPSNGTPVEVLPNLLLIPQTPGGSADSQNPIKIDITYKMAEGQEQSHSIYLPSDTSWDPGRHYHYTLSIGSAKVTLKVNVVDWDERNFSVEF